MFLLYDYPRERLQIINIDNEIMNEITIKHSQLKFDQ